MDRVDKKRGLFLYAFTMDRVLFFCYNYSVRWRRGFLKEPPPVIVKEVILCHTMKRKEPIM